MALANNGVDEHMRVVGSYGKRLILRNVTASEVDTFRSQVYLVDLIGCEDADQVIDAIDQLAAPGSPTATTTCDCSVTCVASPHSKPTQEVIMARPVERTEMDPAGYFVIIPDARRQVVVVEHYAYDNKLQHVVEGVASRDIYRTLIDAGWVRQLSHAAYLGRELAAAELSLRHGFTYVQDKT
jgi:tetrahydromethanopterin S-methyltransferase subunit A